MEPTKRPRGRPPSPDGPTPKAEIQRRYRERLKAKSSPPAVDPETQKRLQAARDHIAYLKADRDRWQADCAKAEAELRLEQQHHLNTIKDKIVLQQEIAALKAPAKPAKGRRIKIT